MPVLRKSCGKQRYTLVLPETDEKIAATLNDAEIHAKLQNHMIASSFYLFYKLPANQQAVQ